jgi:hypothetical protein
MFELKKGMKVKTKFGYIEEVQKVEKEKNRFWYNVSYCNFKDIDWEETAKLNGIDLDFIELDNKVGKVLRETEKEYNPKYDKDKLDWTLLPINEVEEIVKVLDFGKQKYSAHAWKGVENAEQRYLSATYRHLVEYTKGNKIYEESGLSHLSHLATNIIFLMWFERSYK